MHNNDINEKIKYAVSEIMFAQDNDKEGDLLVEAYINLFNIFSEEIKAEVLTDA